MKILWIAVFGVFGVLARFGVDTALRRNFELEFPLGILAINVIGGFLAGLTLIAGREKIVTDEMYLALTVGFLGGFTTFSAYCLDSVRYFLDGQTLKAISYFVASPALALAATFAGLTTGRLLFLR